MDQPNPQTPPNDGEAMRVFRKLGAAGKLAVVAAFMPALAGFALLWKIDAVSEWLKSHEGYGVFVYALGFAALAGLALLPTYAQAILGGWAFGVTLGAPAALAGFTGGAWLGYEIARRAGADKVEAVLSEKPRWRAVRDALVGEKNAGFFRTVGKVTLLRLPPNSPFALTNLVLASVNVPRAAYLLGTCIGMAPRTVLAVVLGAGIKGALTKDALQQAVPTNIKVGLAMASVAIVLVIWHIASQAWARSAGLSRE